MTTTKKDDYIYQSAYDGKVKVKGPISDEEFSKYYEEIKQHLGDVFSFLSRENIKEIKEESADDNKKVYLVELNDKEKIKSGSVAEINVDDCKVKMGINKDGTVSEISFEDLKIVEKEKTYTLSRIVTINAIGKDVAPIEVPEDADSYMEYNPDELEDDELDDDVAEVEDSEE